MKILLLFLVTLALGSCLYEGSEHVRTLTWATFQKDVMQSEDAWFLNFASDSCADCKKFASIYEKAAETQKGTVNYGYVNAKTEKQIVNFFGMGGENHQIFLNHEKPGTAGSPAFFSWPKDLKNLISFATNEIFVKKRQPLFKGTKYMQKLVTKADLDNKVLKSKDPWFLLFCTEQNMQDCMEIVGDYHEAAVALHGKVKFGYVDIMKSEIVNVFGISGTGVCIFLGADKPGPVGGPSLVGSQLKRKDYEKHVWDIIELAATDSAKQIVAQYPSIPEVTYQQMNKGGAHLILFYSGSEVFGNDEQLTQQLQALSNLTPNSKISVGKMSVDNNKWIVGHLDIWPVPSLVYLPIQTKTAETLVAYEGKYDAAEISSWAAEQLYDNEHDKQIILNRQNFETQVINSEEAWFVQFYTLNKNWCRKCEHLQPEWKKLSGAVDGKVNIAKFNCDNGKDICQKFEVFNFPKLVYMPPGQKLWSMEKNIDFDGAFSKEAMLQFTLDNISIIELSKVAQVSDQQSFDKYCKNFNGICFLSIIPKNGAPGSKDRQWYLNQIQYANEDLVKEPVSFMWAVDGDQPHLQQRFKLCPSGYPCTVGIDSRVDKKLGYKVFSRDWSSNDLKKNVSDLLEERRAFIPIRQELPEILTLGADKHTDL